MCSLITLIVSLRTWLSWLAVGRVAPKLGLPMPAGWLEGVFRGSVAGVAAAAFWLFSAWPVVESVVSSFAGL